MIVFDTMLSLVSERRGVLILVVTDVPAMKNVVVEVGAVVVIEFEI